jgi:nicotinate-nucleotide--dimethylbenzimidazole phosphoribosyltransferase
MNATEMQTQEMQAQELRSTVLKRLDRLTKPLGALGRIEELALHIACQLGEPRPRLRQPQMLVCAADHGVTAQGVSAFPAEVTRQMVLNMLAGGAAISVLARQHGLALTLADCGVRAVGGEALPEAVVDLRVPGLEQGTQDLSQGPAMRPEQAEQAMDNGAALLRRLPGNALLIGDMGIGNTSAAALLMARLTGLPLADCVGRGAGLDDAQLARKQAVLARALQANAPGSPLQTLAQLGGLEIATLAGAVRQALAERRVVVVDGFIASAAVAVARRAAARCRRRLRVLRTPRPRAATRAGSQRLGVRPLLDLGLRLGEGSGAALAWPLLVSACALLDEMASFDSAGVSERDPA